MYKRQVETRTCTNPSTEYCSAKCSPLASESPRAWIKIRHSVRRFQLHLDRQLAHRTSHRRAHLRSNTEVDSRELAASLLSPKPAASVVVAVHMLSTAGRHSPITTVLCPAFKCGTRRKECTRVCHFLACLFVDSRASQIDSSQINYCLLYTSRCV